MRSADCFYDGKDDCMFYYIPHLSYFVARTPKISRTIPVPFTENGLALRVPARWWSGVTYVAVAWLEVARTLLRTLIHIDQLRPDMTNTTNSTADERVALWDAAPAFSAWRAANTFFVDIIWYFTNHDSVVSFIRYLPLLVGEIINRWVDLIELLYNMGMNLIVGAVDVAEGVLPIRVIFRAFQYDWETYFVEPGLHTCYVAGLVGGNNGSHVYPLGCILESGCTTLVQLVNNSAYLIGWAVQGAAPCLTQLPNGSRVTVDHCWSQADADLMYQPAIAAAGAVGRCLPELFNMFTQMGSSLGAYNRSDTSAGCAATAPHISHCQPGGCEPTEEHVESLAKASLQVYPQGALSDYWSHMCVQLSVTPLCVVCADARCVQVHQQHVLSAHGT